MGPAVVVELRGVRPLMGAGAGPGLGLGTSTTSTSLQAPAQAATIASTMEVVRWRMQDETHRKAQQGSLNRGTTCLSGQCHRRHQRGPVDNDAIANSRVFVQVEKHVRGDELGAILGRIRWPRA